MNGDSFKEVNQDRGTSMMLGTSASNSVLLDHKGQGRTARKMPGPNRDLLCQAKEVGQRARAKSLQRTVPAGDMAMFLL